MPGKPEMVAWRAPAQVPEYTTSVPKLAPLLIPESTASGGAGRMHLSPLTTQSTGAPEQVYHRSFFLQILSGSFIVMALEMADRFLSGATTHTSWSTERLRASSIKPAPSMPSSFVIRSRIDEPHQQAARRSRRDRIQRCAHIPPASACTAPRPLSGEWCRCSDQIPFR